MFAFLDTNIQDEEYAEDGPKADCPEINDTCISNQSEKRYEGNRERMHETLFGRSCI
jgi:hypothetical protein